MANMNLAPLVFVNKRKPESLAKTLGARKRTNHMTPDSGHNRFKSLHTCDWFWLFNNSAA